MVGLVEIPAVPPPGLGFSVSHQKVELEIDLAQRHLSGRTEVTIVPDFADLKTIRLNCRQCQIIRSSMNGKPVTSWEYSDPYKESTLPWRAGVHQYHLLQQRIENELKVRPEQELALNLPRSVRIGELDPFTPDSQGPVLAKTADGVKNGFSDAIVIDLTQNTKTAVEHIVRFTPIIVRIEFIVEEIRDGLHFVGWEEGDLRYPHVYTRNSSPSAASCLFPCLDVIDSRCTWEFSIKCPRTIGDALKAAVSNGSIVGDGVNGDHNSARAEDGLSNFTNEDQALDLVIICSGEMTDEVMKPLEANGCIC